MIERILPLAEKVKDNWSLCEFFADMGNRASEKEYMVAETIHACKINYAQHTEFRPPGVTHSAPLGRRSFLQIPPPLRVSLKWAGSERFL
jgi:hypothetical protein